MPTRRAVIAGLTGVGGLTGCLSTDEGTAAPADEYPSTDVEPRVRPDIDIALWTWADDPGEFRASLSRELGTDFVITIDPYRSRSALEAGVAERLTEHRAPETFQTIAGKELGRYVLAVTVHDIPDLVPGGRFRRGVDAQVTLDNEPFAVPVTVECTNWLAVAQTNDATVEDSPNMLAALQACGDPADGARLVFPDAPEWWFRLFCLELLATTGIDGIDEMRAGTPRIGTIRPALERLVTLRATDRLAHGDWQACADRIVEGTAVAALGDARLGVRVEDSERSISPVHWPATGRVASISVTAFPFPKRAVNAHGTTAVLEALGQPAVQSRLAALAGMLPARADTEISLPFTYLRAWDRSVENADIVSPSPATGCGLNPDARARALALFDTHPMEQSSIDEFARLLRDAL